MSTIDNTPAPRGLLGLADDPATAAQKLSAAIDTANREAAAPFATEFQPPAPSGTAESVGRMAPTS